MSSFETSQQAVLREVANQRLTNEINRLNSPKMIVAGTAITIATVIIGIGRHAAVLRALVKEHQISDKLAKAEKEKAQALKASKAAQQDRLEAEIFIEEVKQTIEICSRFYKDNSRRWECLAHSLGRSLKIKSDGSFESLDKRIGDLEDEIETSRRRISGIKGSVNFCEGLYANKDYYDDPEELDRRKWRCFQTMESKLTKPRKKRRRLKRKPQTRRR